MGKMLVLFSLIIFLTSCGLSDKEKIQNAIERGQLLISQGRCAEASLLLEGVGRQTTNYDYLRVLSSSYACMAGFSEPTFFGTDLPNIGSSVSAESLWGILSEFSTSSQMTSPTSSEYQNLVIAINILLYAGGGITSDTEPTVGLRSRFIVGQDLKNLHAQAMYMLLSAIGMYVYHYGDASGGLKSSNADTAADNDCFIDYNQAITFGATDYPHANLGVAIGALPAANACSGSLDSGHPDLDPVAATPDTISRLCEGAYLFNNLKIVVDQVVADIASGMDDLAAVATIQAIFGIQSAILESIKPGITDVNTVLSQEVCIVENTADTQYLQVYTFYYYETLFN